MAQKSGALQKKLIIKFVTFIPEKNEDILLGTDN